ncbi:hypothetical protein VOI54_07165 [Tamlana sp. 2201CG12-4]|uniref:hypothetical protein n=1 Tax=Tamlana sp. 2201CG12-4 TaxID=3112582 RepID=UPI002DB83DE2|nr:hypothetical protein [Tamlana sp. 2201CG12-4]MEC3906793.1 hypothetical protein [Tamlana sp. 2201CG12-4]
MKTIKLVSTITLLLVALNVSAQTLSKKQQERENNEVTLLTQAEKEEIQLWFYQEVQDMNMDEETLAAYESNLLVYTSRMMRLDDKDLGYTQDEIVSKFDDLIKELNKKMEDILPEEQYNIHEFNFKVLSGYVKLRMNIETPTVNG